MGLSGDLRLAVNPTTLIVVAELTAEFGDAHPRVRFSVRSKTSVQILSMLNNLEIDAGLTYLNNEPLGRVTTVPLYSERYVLVAKAGHPLLAGPVKSSISPTLCIQNIRRSPLLAGSRRVQIQRSRPRQAGAA
jgi:DNA-binding transcriptional LysR family regulator